MSGRPEPSTSNAVPDSKHAKRIKEPPLEGLDDVKKYLNVEGYNEAQIQGKKRFFDRLRSKREKDNGKLSGDIDEGTWDSFFSAAKEKGSPLLLSNLERLEEVHKLQKAFSGYVTESNRAEDKETRDNFLQSLKDYARNNEDLASELYLTLVKQTRHESNYRQCLSTWQLFVEVSKVIACPTILQEFVRNYIKKRATSSKECAPVTHSAATVMNNRFKKSPGELNCASFSVRFSEIWLVDDTKVKIAYNQTTTVEDAACQASWKTGMDHTRAFQIFRVTSEKEKMLEKKGSFSFALQNTPRNGRLVLKRWIFPCGLDLELPSMDVRARHLTYVQARNRILEEGCPYDKLKENYAYHLILQVETGVFADYPPNNPMNSEITLDSLRQVLQERKTAKSAVESDNAGQEFDKQMNNKKEEFICWTLDLKCGNCTYFKASQETTRSSASQASEDKSATAEERKPVKLAVNNQAVYIFDDTGKELKCVEICQLKQCCCENDVVKLMGKTYGSDIEELLRVKDGPFFQLLVLQHKKKYKADAFARNKLGISDSSSSSTRDFTSLSSDSSVRALSASYTSTCEAYMSGMNDERCNTEECSLSNCSSRSRNAPVYRILCVAEIRRIQPETFFMDRFEIRGRYLVEPFYLLSAYDNKTEQECWLKFYENEDDFSRVVEMHEKMKDLVHVCSAINVFPSVSTEEGKTLPFIAVKRGETSLEKWIDPENKHYNLEKTATANQLLIALRDLHEKDVVLKRIRPENFCRFSAEGKWKICNLDFVGMAEVCEFDTRDVNHQYTPPEIIESVDDGAVFSMTKAANLWSLGALLIRIFTDTGPFGPDTTPLSRVKELMSNKSIPGREFVADPKMRRIIENLMHFDPSERTLKLYDDDQVYGS